MDELVARISHRDEREFGIRSTISWFGSSRIRKTRKFWTISFGTCSHHQGGPAGSGLPRLEALAHAGRDADGQIPRRHAGDRRGGDVDPDHDRPDQELRGGSGGDRGGARGGRSGSDPTTGDSSRVGAAAEGGGRRAGGGRRLRSAADADAEGGVGAAATAAGDDGAAGAGAGAAAGRGLARRAGARVPRDRVPSPRWRAPSLVPAAEPVRQEIVKDEPAGASAA